MNGETEEPGLAQATNGDAGRGDILTPRRPDTAAYHLMGLSSAFLVAGASLFSLLLIKLAVPGLFDATAAISYGRLRPAAISLLVFGFGGTLTHAIAYYLTPRLVGAPLRRQGIALLNGYGYAGLVGIGALILLLRGPSGGEFGEFPLVLDVLMALSMLLPAVLVTETLRDRTERGMFVSLLYVLGAVWWYPALYIVANVPVPGGVGTMLQTAVASFGYLTMALPAAALGGAFYVVVKEADAPLYSGNIARAAFWTLAGTSLVAAPGRFVSGPAPAWLESIATVMSLGVAVAAIAALTVLVLTVADSWDTVRRSPAVMLTLAGAASFTAVSVLFGVHAFRSVGSVVGLTTWYEGLAYGMMAVAVPLLGMGFIFHAFPRATGREIFDRQSIYRGVRITLWAGGATSVLLVVAGVISGLSWTAGVSSGAFGNTGAGFQQSLGQVSTLYTVAALTSIVAVVGLGLIAWNVTRTFTSGAARPFEVLIDVDGAAP